MPSELVEIGTLVGPHGIRGEVKAHVPDPRTSSLLHARRIVLKRGAERLECEVTGARPTSGTVLLTISGISDRNSAEKLRGFSVSVDVSDMPPLGTGEYYLHQLKGLAVVDAKGTVYGTVTSISTNSAQDLLVVDVGGGRESLVPLVEAIVKKISLEERKVLIDPPEGLFD